MEKLSLRQHIEEILSGGSSGLDLESVSPESANDHNQSTSAEEPTEILKLKDLEEKGFDFDDLVENGTKYWIKNLDSDIDWRVFDFLVVQCSVGKTGNEKLDPRDLFLLEKAILERVLDEARTREDFSEIEKAVLMRREKIEEQQNEGENRKKRQRQRMFGSGI